MILLLLRSTVFHRKNIFANLIRKHTNKSLSNLIRGKWLESAAGLGQPVRVMLARDEEVRGRFLTIDAHGRMVVATAQGERVLDAGDVFLAHDESNVLEQSGLRS